MAERNLPPEFAELERFVPEWSIDTEAGRNRHRLAASYEQLQDFYRSLLPHMDAIITRLREQPLDALADADQRLLNLALMFMAVAPSVEIFRSVDVPGGFAAERFHILPG